MSDKMKAPDNAKHGLEGPNSYHAITPPSSKELGAPVKVYPGSKDLGKGDKNSGMIEGPCTGKVDKGYHK